MRLRIVSYLLWVALAASIYLVSSPVFAPASALPLLAAPVIPSPTPTLPAPVLLEPANGAALPQPVAPRVWTFRWSALREAYCKCSIAVWQPDAQIYLGEQNIASSREYVYYYTTASPLPPDSLAPWYWKVWITCPNGANESETRTFRIEPNPTPTPVTRLLLPLLWKMLH